MTSAEFALIRLDDMLRVSRDRNASDLHLAPGDAPVLRVDGRLERLGAVHLDAGDIEAMLPSLFSEDDRACLLRDGERDAAVGESKHGSLRVHGFRAGGRYHLAIRMLAAEIPSLDELGLPTAIASFAQRRNGLVLFAGPAGSGKSTALASFVDHINQTAARHIVTIEDPVEYRYQSKRSLVTQRALGNDVADWAGAVRAALRADPDVIVIGELRDAATMHAALTAAETGHLVVATLHTGDAVQTVDRILSAFEPAGRSDVAIALAQTLIATVALRLVPRLEGTGRRAACEILIASDAVRALIRDGKTHLLRNAIVTGRAAGMQTLEAHLTDLVLHREVALEDARRATNYPAEIRVAAVPCA